MILDKVFYFAYTCYKNFKDGKLMNAQEYLTLLKKRLAHYYDEKPLPKSPQFTLAAELNAADEGYFIVPNLKTYSVQHNEYLYVQTCTAPLTETQIEPYLQFTKQAMNDLKTTTEHMSSIFMLAFICEAGIEQNALEKLIHLRQHKDYCFTLKGWSDLALYLIDIPQQKLYYNKAGGKNTALFSLPEPK